MNGKPPPPVATSPRSPADLFWACTALALQGFGGVLAVAQRELVERRRWLTPEQFLEDWATAQVMPGPNIVNLTLMIGGRHFGWRGAAAALAGMLLAPLVVLLVIAAAFAQVAQEPMAQGALRGMGAVAAGLILGTAVKMAAPLRSNPMGIPVCAVLAIGTALAIGEVRLPLAGVLAVAGGLGWWLAARAVRRKRASDEDAR